MSQSRPNKHSLKSNNQPTNLYLVICCTNPKVKFFLCTIRINRGYQATNYTQSTNQSGTMMVPVYSWDTTLCVYIYIYRWGELASLECFWGSGRAIIEHDQGHFHKARWTIQQGDIARQKSCWLLQYTSKTMEWLVGYRGDLIHKNGGGIKQTNGDITWYEHQKFGGSFHWRMGKAAIPQWQSTSPLVGNSAKSLGRSGVWMCRFWHLELATSGFRQQLTLTWTGLENALDYKEKQQHLITCSS